MTLADSRKGLVAYLYGDATISTLVGGAVARADGGDRIFAVKLPQRIKATSIVYRFISGVGDHHMQGASGLARPRIQIDCYAASLDDAWTLANAVKERIDGFSGSMLWGDNSPEEAIVVQGIFMQNEFEDYDEAAELYRVSRDYFVWFEES